MRDRDITIEREKCRKEEKKEEREKTSITDRHKDRQTPLSIEKFSSKK